ncbi:hypothetical protein TSAR_005476 [Trichomalopsis sarcophagae]|uniref:Uncharacterized protein n=1 Tax=Trichomalopsis sarcophagae TaxID=543379 RepID=A0A232FDP5_9HYME|nr:hypothetical protein TSAR_005476 [Trichomalopsis sarcophagae]
MCLNLIRLELQFSAAWAINALKFTSGTFAGVTTIIIAEFYTENGETKMTLDELSTSVTMILIVQAFVGLNIPMSMSPIKHIINHWKLCHYCGFMFRGGDVIGLLTVYLLPESPHWLASKIPVYLFYQKISNTAIKS